MNQESLNIILTKFKEDKLTLEETSKLICSLSSTNTYYYPYKSIIDWNNSTYKTDENN